MIGLPKFNDAWAPVTKGNDLWFAELLVPATTVAEREYRIFLIAPDGNVWPVNV